MRQKLLDKGAYFWPTYSTAGHPDKSPSWLRRLLGDINVPGIYRPSDCGIDDEDIKGIFPEANLWDYIPVVG